MTGERFFVPLLIAAITLAYSYPLFANQICLGWDCPFYMFNLSDKVPLSQIIDDRVEPLFFALMKPVADYFGVVPAIKMFNLISIPVFLCGVWLLCRKFGMSLRSTLLVVTLLGLAPGTTRMWLDQYRNFLAYMIMPYIFWTFFRFNSFFPAASLIIVSALSHRFFVLPVAALGIFCLFSREHAGRFLKVSGLVGGILLVVVATSVISGERLQSSIDSLFIHAYSYPSLETVAQQFQSFFYFNGMFFFFALMAMIILRDHKPSRFFWVMFAFLFFILIMYGQAFAGRLELVIAFPMCFLIAIGYERMSRFPKNARVAVLVSIIAMMGISCMFGALGLLNASQNASDSEISVMSGLGGSPDKILIVDSRINGLARFYTGFAVNYTDWYDLVDGRPKVTPSASVLFLGAEGWRDIATNETYLLWDYARDPVNETLMRSRIDAGEIKVLISNGTTVFGRLVP